MDKLTYRNISIAILLIVILIIVLVFRNHNPFGKDQTSFAADPDKEITRIELSGGGKKLILGKAGDLWMVNDRNEARRSGVTFILRIVTGIKIKSPVSPEIFEQEIVNKNIEGVRVKVMSHRRHLSSFIVYKTQSNRYGNIMKVREGARPFIVYVPGFEGDIGSGFTLNELFWLPFTVFNLLPSEISAVTLENITEPSAAFNIIRKGKMLTLSDPENNTAVYDSARIMRYISYFTMIPFESWAFELSEEEVARIRSGTPLFIISVTKQDGSLVKLTLWEKVNFETGEKDSDRLWGMTGESGALFTMRYFDIDPLLKRKTYFLTE